MDMEEMRWALTQAKMRCHILELESRVNTVARDTQESWADRYQKILAELVGEGEEMKSLALARLCCCILEIDRDAEAGGKDMESYHAFRHLQILSELTGEPVTHSDPQTHAVDVTIQMMLQRAPVPSTLPAICQIQIHLVLS